MAIDYSSYDILPPPPLNRIIPDDPRGIALIMPTLVVLARCYIYLWFQTSSAINDGPASYIYSVVGAVFCSDEYGHLSHNTCTTYHTWYYYSSNYYYVLIVEDSFPLGL